MGLESLPICSIHVCSDGTTINDRKLKAKLMALPVPDYELEALRVAKGAKAPTLGRYQNLGGTSQIDGHLRVMTNPLDPGCKCRIGRRVLMFFQPATCVSLV